MIDIENTTKEDLISNSQPIYFVLRKANCGTYNALKGKMDTDIIGITTDEEYAKSKQSVFCYYEPVILLEH